MKKVLNFLITILLILILLFSINASAYAAVVNEIRENVKEEINNEEENISDDEDKNNIQENELMNNNVTNEDKSETSNEINNETNNVVNNETENTTNEIENEVNNTTKEEIENINATEDKNVTLDTYNSDLNENVEEQNTAEQEKTEREINVERTKADGIYKMVIGKDSNKSIEVAGSDTGDNAKADIWDFGNAAAQKFYFEYENGFYKITVMHTGKSLTVKGNNLIEGAEIVQAEYEGLDSQKWILRDTGKNGWVISLQSNPDLSISVKGSITNGSILILSKTEDNDNQMLWLYDITAAERTHADGTYKIAIGKDSSKALEVSENSIELWNFGNATAQKFYFEYEEGFYKITAMHTGKSLTVKDNKIEEGTEIVQADYEGLDSQKWILRDSNKNGWIISLLSNPQLSISIKGNIENGANLILSRTQDNDKQMYWISNVSTDQSKKENGIYKIVMGVDSNKAIEVAGSATENNAKVDIWDFGNATAQKFYFEYEEGFYKITAMHTGKSLTVKDNNLKEGAEIVQADYEGLDSQKWILRDTTVNGWVMSLQSNPDLSISVKGNVVNGSILILSKTEDNNNQILWLYDITEGERTHTDGIYKMSVGVNTNKVIEVAGSSKKNNAKVDIWDFGNATAQKFNLEYKEGYYKITARHTGKSLTAKGGKIEEGTQVVQADYQGLDSQKWILRDSNKNGWIISPSSNPSLSISIKGNIENGAILELSKTQDNNNQMFALFNITSSEQVKVNGIYKVLVGANTSKGIEVGGSSTANNATIDIWNYGNVDAQKFNFEYEAGFYKITAKHTGKSLTVKDNNLVEGAEIVQYDYQGLDSQKWILRDTEKNGWVISLLSNPDLSISIKGNIENGAKLILSKTEDNDNQMFYLYLTQITIVINPGHGGSETGCANGWMVEKNLTLEIAKKIQANLSKYEDINVILTRTGDYDVDLASRAMIARNNNADLYVSLHINDEESHTATGSQMYVPFYEGTKHYNSNMTRLANLIQDKLGAIGIRENLSGGTTKRNIDQLPKYQYLMDGQVVQADYYADIRHAMKGDTMDYGPDLNTNTGVPAILVEHCFMNSSDSQFLDSDYDLQRIADADSEAIIEYFNL